LRPALEGRLIELKEEYQKGQKKLLTLNQEATGLENTMLRISGAIQVLEELLGDETPTSTFSSGNGIEAKS
jgi:hypothetical protein